MFKHILCFVFCALSSLALFAQEDSLNMEMYYNFDDGGTYNDCWGYTDSNGNEYAILGESHSIYFFDITDPTNTVLVRKVTDNEPYDGGTIDLDNTIWRDFKTFGDKAYAVADQGNEGLIVFDLSALPDTVYIEDQITSFFTQSHNIYIDEGSGYLYTAGASTGNTFYDIKVLDLNVDPIVEIADLNITGGYIHDIHVVNDTAYCNSGSSGGLVIYDFTDINNIAFLGQLDNYTGMGYNHSSWRTEDGDYLIFCDETHNRKVKMLDVTDPANLSNADITDQFFSNLLNPGASNPSSIAHNPFVKGDYAYVAYYHDGVQIFDISDPENVVRVAYYDTYANVNYSGYNGVWGVYPFFDSGTIIASDGSNGLFVLEATLSPLPVELIDFTAVLEKKKTRLNWSTVTERNSYLFDVERSSDGIHFYSINSVEASFNSTTRIDYKVYDDQPLPGVNYYRLKQIDRDGEFEYSEIVSIQFNGTGVKVVPSFITNGQNLNLHFEEPVNELIVNVINANGQQIKSFVLSNTGQSIFELPLSEMENALYFLNIQYDGYSVTEKVVVSN